MVIAIIGILAAILIPAIGAVSKRANIGASKAQLSAYANAILLFKNEYKYFPFPDAHVDRGANINELSTNFVETLSARTEDGEPIATGGNRKRIAFHDFAQNEFLFFNERYDFSRIVDRFNNDQLFIAIDGDGDGRIVVPDPDNPGMTMEVRTPVTAYAEENLDVGGPDYFLYD